MKSNVFAGIGVFVSILLQIAADSGAFHASFFPAAVFYFGTYLPISAAVAIGILAGVLWDSISLLPFGIYAFGLGAGLGGVSFFMRLMDERKVSARGFLACVAWSIFVVILGIIAQIAGEDYVYQGLSGVFTLLVILFGHRLLQKIKKGL